MIPRHLIVIGGGYVGLELSHSMRRFGSKVSVIDRNNRLLRREDEDVSEGLRRLFEDEGIDLVLKARLKRVSGTSGQSVQAVVEQDGVENILEALICLSRRDALRTHRISDSNWPVSN